MLDDETLQQWREDAENRRAGYVESPQSRRILALLDEVDRFTNTIDQIGDANAAKKMELLLRAEKAEADVHASDEAGAMWQVRAEKAEVALAEVKADLSAALEWRTALIEQRDDVRAERDAARAELARVKAASKYAEGHMQVILDMDNRYDRMKDRAERSEAERDRFKHLQSLAAQEAQKKAEQYEEQWRENAVLQHRAERAEAERDHLLQTFFAACPQEDHEHGAWCGSNWAALKARTEKAEAALSRVRTLADEWTMGRVRAPYIGNVGRRLRAVLEGDDDA